MSFTQYNIAPARAVPAYNSPQIPNASVSVKEPSPVTIYGFVSNTAATQSITADAGNNLLNAYWDTVNNQENITYSGGYFTIPEDGVYTVIYSVKYQNWNAAPMAIITYGQAQAWIEIDADITQIGSTNTFYTNYTSAVITSDRNFNPALTGTATLRLNKNQTVSIHTSAKEFPSAAATSYNVLNPGFFEIIKN